MIWHVPAVLVLASAAASGQETTVPVFRAGTRLVLTNFRVTKGGEAVPGIRKEDVSVFEGGKEQAIAVFEAPGTRERIPLEAAFLLDVSGTVVGSGLLDARVIQGGFLAGLGRGAEISVYSFAKEWRRHCGPTRDAGALNEALKEAGRQKHDGTSLYRAVAEVAQELGAAPRVAQRVLFVVSDGLPDGDTARQEQAVEAANAAGVRVFPILLRHSGRTVSGDAARDDAMRRDMEMRLLTFAGLGRDTGGRSFDPEQGLNRETMRRILASTAGLLNAEYTAGYYAGAAEGKAKPRRVSVKLRNGKLGKVSGGTRTVVR